MTSFDVNASLFRIAAMFQSSEETRYYLNGVYIEPHHEQGVMLIATDGHRMFAAHDKAGKIVGDAVIVQLGKDQLKACKEVRGDANPRRIVATADKAPLTITADGKPVSIQADWRIEGTFPDWRRAVKGATGIGSLKAFDAKLMKSFADAGEALSGSPRIDISHASDEGPVLVRFWEAPHAVGVIMPVRWKGDRGWPSFFDFEPNPPVDADAEPQSEAA